MAEVASLEARVSLTGTEQVKRAGEQTAQALGKIAGSAQHAGDRAAVAGRGFLRMRGRTQPANTALFEMGRVLEDLPFGFRGVANNIPQMILSLTRLKDSSAASGQTVRRALLGALTGPSGLVFAASAVSAAMIFLPDLLRKTKDEAGEAARDVGALAESLLRLRDATGPVGFTAESLRTAIAGQTQLVEIQRRATQEISKQARLARSTLEGTQREREFARARFEALSGGVVATRQMVDNLTAAARRSRDALADEEKRLQTYKAQLAEAEALQREETRLLQLGGERIEQLRKTRQEARQLFAELTRLFGGVGFAPLPPVVLAPPPDVAGPFGEPDLPVRQLSIDTRRATQDTRRLATEWQVVMEEMTLAIEAGAEPFVDTLSTGIAGIVFGLRNMRDLLRSIRVTMAQVAAELLKIGITRLISAGIGALTGGPAGAAAGVLSPFGLPGSPVGRVASASAAPGPLQFSASVSGTDLVFLIEQTQARRAR